MLAGLTVNGSFGQCCPLLLQLSNVVLSHIMAQLKAHFHKNEPKGSGSPPMRRDFSDKYV